MTDRLEAAPAPHILAPGVSTRRLFTDVLVALAPVVLAAVVHFRQAAVVRLAACVAAAVAAEALACRLRRRRQTIGDGSAVITGLILGLCLPPGLPLFQVAVGAFVAIGLGKAVFGGLGHNPFNPAMVGRAFLMASFPVAMTTWHQPVTLSAVTGATPLAAARFGGGEIPSLAALATGSVAGSLGETSAVAILAGGAWLLVRRAADWRPAVAMLAAVAVAGAIEGVVRGPGSLGAAGHVLAGGALFGAVFVVTDPVTSPLSRPGRWAFGGLVGGLVALIRIFGGYAEGVMFAVLLANAVTPLLDRWTRPRPVGGPVP